MNQQHHQPESERPPDQNNTTNDDEWLTPIEAAALLKVNPRTIQNLIHKGRLPASKVGRLLRIHKDDINAYMRNHRVN